MKRTISLLLLTAMLLTLLTGFGGVQSAEALAPAEEYQLEKEPGCNQLTLYWCAEDADYSKCDVWIWFPGKDGHGCLFYPCDYGVKCVVNVPEEVEEVGFIVRRNCSAPGGSSWGSAEKDFPDDRFAVMDGDTVIYLKEGDGGQYVSRDGGATLSQIRTFTLAGIVSEHEIRYRISPAARIESLDEISVTDGSGRALKVAELSSLNNNVVTGVIRTEEELDISRPYEVTIKGYGTLPAVPTDIFDSAKFREEYVYDGDDLGAVISGGETVFKVWAPTASRVVLNLFDAGDGGEAYAALDMEKGEKGVWSCSADCGHGTYYTYSVSTAVGTQEAVDPYARAVGVNGDRGMVVDLALTDPGPSADGTPFAEEGYYAGVDSYEQAVIWEVHVRDFSNTIAASAYPGKYLAFTETGLQNSAGLPVGVDYLRQLGVTHVHLQPVYDYATVDESSDEPQFNWGYDPKNYNVPEGSYATDPCDGAVRITEFKQMVRSLHENGMGVIMDVVYNHTYELNSSLNRIVPYYYYRFDSSGVPSNGSGCGNETASNRAMFRKFIVDSVRYWAEEYKVDGFRFDLMALHDMETMQAVEQAVHAVNPRAILYGEGWTGGSTPLNPNMQASQANIGKIQPTEGAIGGIAVFNDAIRDGLKGSVFDPKDAGYINGSANKATAAKVSFGIIGGLKTPGITWHVPDAMVVNYMSSHDNNTLWDKLETTVPEASLEDRLAMNRLGASVVMLSRGMPFFLAGEEMLRTKGGDGNSYASSDAVNNLDWEALTPDSDAWAMSRFYAALIELRKENAFLTAAQPVCETLEGNVIAVSWEQDGETVAYALINPNGAERSFSLPEGDWTLLLSGEEVFPAGGEQLGGSVEAPARGVLLVKK